MRLFFAIEIDEQTRATLAQAVAIVRPQSKTGRWTRPENLHVTVQFIGDLPDDSLDLLGAILRRAAGSVRPFTLVFREYGVFGSHADVLWIGIEPAAPLFTLSSQIRMELARAGLPCDNRPYRPHLTIARQVQPMTGRLPAWTLPSICCPVKQISLMESMRCDGVLRYRAVLRAELTGLQTVDP
ncbi:MAG: RNA 2',3'-cyclic phosphodiesterase [Bacillota bacterium]|nr:RNA 2',3'-cyclic phosphodiesterase [Bacillota bacterium]